MPSSLEAAGPAGQWDGLGIAFYPLVIETLLFGLFTGLITLSTYLLIWRATSRVNRVMLSLTIVMYTAAAVHWVVSVTVVACILKNSCPLSVLTTPHGTARQIITGMMLNINFMTSDVIVLWRAWILWDRNRIVLVVSAVLSLGTIGACLVSDSAHVLPAEHLETDSALCRAGCAIASATVGEGVPVSSAPTSQAAVAVALLSLLSNVWATALVGCTAWLHRRRIVSRLGDGDRRTRIEVTLGLLVESGSLYCLFWILVVLSSKARLGALGPVVAACIVQVAGMYPTALVALVALQKTHERGPFTYDDAAVFTTHLSAGPSSDTHAARGADEYELRTPRAAPAVSSKGPGASTR